MTLSERPNRRGSALLGVLWLSIALSAMAFTLARTVRTEFDRAALHVESTRAYFLARGGIERALLRLRHPSGNTSMTGYRPGQRWMRFSFPMGEVEVEIIGESGKLNLNNASARALARVMTASGLGDAFASITAARIVAARQRSRREILDPGGSENSDDDSSLSRPRASFNHLEELLLLPGVTPEILFGAYRRDELGKWNRVGGLYHHFSPLGSNSVDVNYASPALLRAAGLPVAMIQSILETRAHRPIERGEFGLAEFSTRQRGDDGAIRVTTGGSATAYTVWARALLANGRTRRSVGVLVRRVRREVQVIRWYDTEF